VPLFNYADQESVLFFTGHESIHGLYDFLLNATYHDDTPTLLAPVSFVNSTLKQAKIKSNGSFSRIAEGKAGMETHYALELEGPLLPSGLIQLCQVLKQAQKETFSALFKTLSNTVGMNFTEESSTSASPSSSPVKLLPDNLSVMKQFQERSTLGRNVIKKIVCANGEFTITAKHT
jgi:hypothetical protein